jgi:hypothetical protein
VKVVAKFQRLIRKLNYSKIRLVDFNVFDIRDWCMRHMPQVVDQLEELNWDLSAEHTWTEAVFVNTAIKWYDKNVAVYITSSLLDYNLANKVIATTKFKCFRQRFFIDAQCIVLVDPTIFLEPEDLDLIYMAFDFEKGYSGVDLSHYDEEDNLDLDVQPEWGWLEEEDEYWDSSQTERAYNQKVKILQP